MQKSCIQSAKMKNIVGQTAADLATDSVVKQVIVKAKSKKELIEEALQVKIESVKQQQEQKLREEILLVFVRDKWDKFLSYFQ